MKGKLKFQWLAVAIFSIASASALARSDNAAPAELLKSKGLARSRGSIWLLSGDAMALKDARTAKALAVQWKSAQEQQRALESGNQNPQAFIDNYRQQIAWLDQRISAYDHELANLGPAGGSQVANVYHNMLVQERNGLVTEQRRLSTLIGNIADQRGQFQELKQQFNVEVDRLRTATMQAVADLRKSVDEITAKYTELAANEAVSKALKDLSVTMKTRQKLGPSKDLTSAIKWLESFEKSIERPDQPARPTKKRTAPTKKSSGH
jgi:hypothetical protein